MLKKDDYGTEYYEGLNEALRFSCWCHVIVHARTHTKHMIISAWNINFKF
jgi:hypothetical protein